MDKHNLTGLYLSNQLLRDEKDPARKAEIERVIQTGTNDWRVGDSIIRHHEHLRTTPASLLDVLLDNCWANPVDFASLDAARKQARELVQEFGPDTCFEMSAAPHSLGSVVDWIEGAAALVEPLRKCGGKRK
jgi:hypothetical protein